MKKKTWHLDRRSFLRGTGATMALPWMESMAVGAEAKADFPRRFCAVYWPFGVVAAPNEEDRKWGWFPTGEGKKFAFTDVLASM
ncbi:MAG: hypothetical protein VYA84_12535, partial [Planctomycetota bacterium]|nr:hypothetical protein [Planctomycetota bacterium]